MPLVKDEIENENTEFNKKDSIIPNNKKEVIDFGDNRAQMQKETVSDKMPKVDVGRFHDMPPQDLPKSNRIAHIWVVFCQIEWS